MPKDKRNNCEPKGVYRVRNWSEYNAGLIARGSVTMWINESALTMVSEAEPVMRGRPHVYSDALIQALLTLKQVYHLTLRAAQGFAQSLRELAFADLPVPNYTTLSRRAQDRLCSEGYEFPRYGRDYAFLTQTGLPMAFHRLMRLAMMTPSLSCEAIFCVSRVAPMHRLMREICASTRERRP
jgi:hypothetical protein